MFYEFASHVLIFLSTLANLLKHNFLLRKEKQRNKKHYSHNISKCSKSLQLCELTLENKKYS